MSDTGNWGVTSGTPVIWQVAVVENYASSEALANGPLTNETVTGRAISKTPPRRSST